MLSTNKILILAQVTGQIALVAAIPVLTRTLPAEQMGVYQTAFSIAIIAQPLATLRRELLIPVTRAQDTLKERRVALGTTLLVAVSLSLVAAILWQYGDRLFAQTLITTAILVAALSLIAIENAYLIRLGKLKNLAARNLLGGALVATMQIVVAIYAPSALAIAAALLGARLIATFVTLGRQHPTDELQPSPERKRQRGISAIASAIVAGATTQAVIVSSFFFLGPVAGAQIGVGQRIAGLPTGLLGQALGQVALGKVAPLIREERAGIQTELKRMTVKLCALAALSAGALIVFAPIAAEPVLGPGWQLAGIVTAIFALPLSLQLVAFPATILMVPMGRERQLLAIQSTRFATIVLGIAIPSALTDDVIVTCVIASVVWSIGYVPLLWAAFSAARAHDAKSGNNDSHP